jgi:hypothetical protein
VIKAVTECGKAYISFYLRTPELPQCPQTAPKKESGEARDTGTNPKVVSLCKLFLLTV